MYRAVTQNIEIIALPLYAPERSAPEEGRYFWTYTIEIVNHGPVQVQLVSRTWKITDASGRVEMVRGPGVVGETPILEPGGSFRYTSGCALTTASGIMSGSYRMVDSNGCAFDAEIPAFSLDSPVERRVLN
ncbi:ApaG protein [Rhodoblastus acidophilus]|uniref:Protein ApaG n=1 Tax=Rhodoblastus acidophilus TaxID=1074 RepID=A0A212R265_RHOAC|nr:Co2+/Mg2+ efflux protein ApaG [Rhodoblastus acidophilus]MCW2314656.1 ApaG protein [Rhodoblastus acidophilus]PPQ40330.1 Co2+/Mg2+ efflux protein ApaG [Rhodoblastus acidophilus]RAI16889.1 Co2+/Mg2+ efflux protein ApaG [Rhodoblastus acidophilus]SNB66080.1 ApaG protein [Rhodoblastus acidophilus]